MKIRLIRHGATAGQGRYLGRTDLPLSPQGRAALVPGEQPVAKVYVTSLRRTGQTAALLFPGAEQQVVPGLEEMDFGVFEGRSFQDMARDRDYRAWVEGGCLAPCPGGESKALFCARVTRAFAPLVDQALERGEGELVVVAHRGTQMAVMEAFALPPRPYFQWGLPCGRGYLLDAAPWRSRRRLLLTGEVKYTRDG